MASSSGSKDDSGSTKAPARKMTRIPTMKDASTEEDNPLADNELVPSSLAQEIGPVLRVANEIENENPRVAYLCRFHAFKKAHERDPKSHGRGVRQFKTYLLHKLQKEDGQTNLMLKFGRSDPVEIQLFYQFFYDRKMYDGCPKKTEETAKVYQILTVLRDVMETVVPPGKIDEKTQAYINEVEVHNMEQFEHYNILPFYPPIGETPMIMDFPEIKAAIFALGNVSNLPVPATHSKQVASGKNTSQSIECDKCINDILEWLASVFGFQRGNVSNQKEHLILLLANVEAREQKPAENSKLHSRTIENLMTSIFKNYHSWCYYLSHPHNIRFFPDFDSQQLQLVYIGLYLLIWGESSNIRFMPECICYIFDCLAEKLHDIFEHKVHPSSGGKSEIAPHGEESFLKVVITPMYDILLKESIKNRNGKASNTEWRNYDDLNEYFWFRKCFDLDWPVYKKRKLNERRRTDLTFHQFSDVKKKSKTNFVEVRTFWHIYRSFDRMWIFFILTFQAMLIVAWSPSGSIAAFFDEDVFRRVLSIFITSAFLNFLQATLDVILGFYCWRNLKFTQIFRYVLKFIVATVWAVVLPIGYASSVLNPSGIIKFFSSWGSNWKNQSFYTYCVAIYLIPNIISVLLFLLPSLQKKIERSNRCGVGIFMWWAQPKLYIGRGMHEDLFSLLRYTFFWVVLLITKLAFSYYVEILPLIGPTKIIMSLKVSNYDWHEFLPSVPHNIGVVIAIWAPIVLVYFMDTQIWYSIYSTIFGVICGAFSHLGEIRTLGMFRSRFQAIPLAFCKRLIASTPAEIQANDSNESAHLCKVQNFWLVWNEFIKSLRAEDLISHRERDLMVVPDSVRNDGVEQWPPFLLASKIPLALDMAKGFRKRDGDAAFFRKIKSDGYMHSAVIECYETIVDMLLHLFEESKDQRVIRDICKEVDDSIKGKRFLDSFHMSALSVLHEKMERFLNILVADYDKPESEKSEVQKSRVINLIQDVMEIITQDVMVNGNEILRNVGENKELRFEKIRVDIMQGVFLREKIVRLHLLLTVKESVANVPMNLDARRRITFFANSLFMKMPRAPRVQDMLSFSVLTPYVKEDVLYSEVELNEENDDGISILFYLQKIYPDEWTNFQERMKDQMKAIEGNLKDEKDKEKYEKEQARHWASYRGQTLSRTVRGMMYYREALELQCFLESPKDGKNDKKSVALADMKFTYVVSCQNYGAQKKSDDIRERMCYYSVRDLMLMYPSLRVAYIDVREELVAGNIDKVYYSVLLKGGEKFDEEIYRIKLPGRPIIGEGKPENQNHAIIFTRGEALQTIDMNQENYLEEAFKMRNILEEFNQNRRDKRDKYHHEVRSNKDYNQKRPSECRYGKSCPTILGLREHIFTGSVSSLAWFMSNQETSFVTIGQRILANPLRVRFHYGHPDIFDRLFHITRGGVSKASKVINLSEDIFSGFNSTLRGGFVTHHEYIQVGKARDLGMNQISQFEAKVANGNGEQTLSRDVFRLGQRFDFYRMLSFYFTTVGFYFSSLVTVITVYVFLYGRLYLVMSGLENAILQDPSIKRTKALEEALATQSVFQLGLLLVLPMAMEIGLEHGFRTALADLVIMILQMASMFFTFQLGTKAHYFGRAILHGGSKYRATGRGFVVAHARFAENYRMYSRSHFVKGLELFMLLIVYVVYGSSYRSTGLYLFVTISMWFLVVSWLFAPFGFNPSGFEWQKTVDDWVDWKRWMENRGGIGIQQDRSWESWWETENAHLESTSTRGRILEIVLALRFFIYQYGIVYHLDIAHHVKSFLVYGLSWVVMGIFLVVLKIVTTGRRRFGTDFQLMFRILKGLLFLGTVSVAAVLFVVCGLTVSDLFASILAFAPTGWAIILVGQGSKRVMVRIGMWNSVKELARTYEYVMGILIFMPVVILSWFPFVSEFQTRLLFNQAFSRGLQISMILAGKKDRTKAPHPTLPPPSIDPLPKH